jgi:hypothetical protein
VVTAGIAFGFGSFSELGGDQLDVRFARTDIAEREHQVRYVLFSVETVRQRNGSTVTALWAADLLGSTGQRRGRLCDALKGLHHQVENGLPKGERK